MAFEEAKSFVLSKTLMGVALVVVSVVLKLLEQRYGITFSGDSNDFIQSILEIVGLAMAIVGRFTATKTLKVIGS